METATNGNVSLGNYGDIGNLLTKDSLASTYLHEGHWNNVAAGGDTLAGELASIAVRARETAGKIFDYRALCLGEEGASLPARHKKSLEFADKAVAAISEHIDTYSKRVNREVDSLRDVIEGETNRVAGSWEFAREVRQHVAGLPDSKRTAFLTECLKDGDLMTVRAVIGARAFMSGLGRAEHAYLKATFERQHYGDAVARIAKLEKLIGLLQSGGSSLIENVNKCHDRAAVKRLEAHEAKLKAVKDR